MGTQGWLGEAQAQARKRKKKSQLQPLRIAPCAVEEVAALEKAVVESLPDRERLHQRSAERTRADSRRGKSALFTGEAYGGLAARGNHGGNKGRSRLSRTAGRSARRDV